MKIVLNLLLISSALYAQSSQAWWYFSANTIPPITEEASVEERSHNTWLKNHFSKQHQQLIPVVLVADTFFICNQVRKTDENRYKLSFLIDNMHKDTLAEKLSRCLGEETMQSDVALNFGLLGCFHAQLAHLPKADREQKMILVKQAILSLSYDERRKSLTQCVTEQSIHYLK
ncbi:MAG: hypothetical protein V5789_00630 [Colwellia sp.]